MLGKGYYDSSPSSMDISAKSAIADFGGFLDSFPHVQNITPTTPINSD